jgi:hypothetical protein
MANKKKPSKKTAKTWTTSDKLILAGIVIDLVQWIVDRFLSG